MATKEHVRVEAAGRARQHRHPADLVETGNLLRTQSDAFPVASRTEAEAPPSRHDAIVVGAGQAGLSAGYHLKRKGLDFVILEGAARVGDVWRNRWDSLRLFTPAKLNCLDGFRFPASGDTFPPKDAMANYLEAYAQRFALPVRLNTRVERLFSSGGRFRAETSNGVYESDQVVIAASGYQKPRLPAFAREIAADVPQLHSHAYRNPAQLPDGPVLLVGAGNSGAEIAMDLAGTHKVYLSGRNVGYLPFDTAGFIGLKLLDRFVIRGLFHRILTMRTPMGRRFRARMHNHGMPLIRQRPGQLERAGIERVARIVAIEGGRRAVTDDGARVPFASVVWCTGFHPGFDWIDLPILDDHGEPRQRFGRSSEVSGLYFVGLPFQYAMSSTLVAGVGRDARRVAGWIAASHRRSPGH